MPARRRAGRIRGLGRMLGVAASLIAITVKLTMIYTRYRVKLWWWRMLSSMRFRREIRRVPSPLREELLEMYKRRIRGIALPGIRDMVGLVRGGGPRRPADRR